MKRVLPLALTLAYHVACSQLSPNAPPDDPQPLTAAQVTAFDVAIAPYVAEARKSYPRAKHRFLHGLAPGHIFYVATRIRDREGHWEQVFIHVSAIRDEKIYGTIASNLEVVKGYKLGQPYSLNESEIIDWTITNPDGTEDGNVVGKFLDYYRPGKSFVAVFAFSVSADGRAENARLTLLTDETRKRLNFQLPPAWIKAALRKIQSQKWSPQTKDGVTSRRDWFVPFIYNPDRPAFVREVE